MTLLVIVAVHFNPVAQTAAQAKRLDSCLTILNQQHLFNGSILLADKGKVVYEKAYGVSDIRNRESLTTASAFNLGSISKQFLAVLVLKQYEKGKLKLDDPVNRYLPDFPYPQITLRHLLTHTSGLPEYFNWFDARINAGDTIVNRDLYEYLVQNKPALQFPTGERWQYCNTGYALLALVLEKVSGMPFESLLEKDIVKPLQLHETYGFRYRSQVKVATPRRVYGFQIRSDQPKLYDLTPFDGIIGDGSIYSSVNDLYRWAQALDKNKLVKATTMELAYTPVTLNDGSHYHYGFGWNIFDSGNTLNHTGSWVAFANIIERKRKEGQVMIILESSDHPQARQWIRRVLDDITHDRRPTMPVLQLIESAKLADGSGAPLRNANVRVADKWIIDTGKLKPLRGEMVVNGNGKILAPGFIDTHGHYDGDMFEHPAAPAVTSQGVTTVIVGQDGSSELPLANLWKKIGEKPLAINIGSYSGHNSIRDSILGKDFRRVATEQEVTKMKSLLNTDLKSGALGFSTGLEYDPGIYSDPSEVLALAGVAADYHRRYISHIRSEDRHLEAAVRELINIGARWGMPVQISHFKMGIVSQWKNAPYFIRLLDSARAAGINVTADVYPYEYWHSTLSVLLPERNFKDSAAVHFALTQVTTPDGLIVSYCPSDSSLTGKTFAEIALAKKTTPEKLMMDLLEKNEPLGGVGIIARGMHPADIDSILKWPYSNLCSDGSAEGRHPRGWGSFSRYLGKYVREEKLLTWEEAIRKITSLAASNMGIFDRGIIAPGYYADLVLFDPLTVKDRANFESPHLPSAGIEKVWVNGVVVWDGAETKARPGMMIRAD